MQTDESFAARVRSALVEMLPAGECGADDAARRLVVSRRILQRKPGDLRAFSSWCGMSPSEWRRRNA